MVNIEEKGRQILKFEEIFAHRLALQVIERPRLNIWMILIPAIFIYYFYRFHKYGTGCRLFVGNYMKGIQRALQESLSVIQAEKSPDPMGLAKMSDVPESVRHQQAEVYAILIDHFSDLLNADGEDIGSLIRSTYRNRTNYLLFFNRLNQAEKNRNQALKPLLSETTEGVEEVVAQIERCSETLRRELAEKIFPGNSEMSPSGG